MCSFSASAANVNVISVAEEEIASYNAQNGASYLARGYYVYDEAPADGLLSKNGKYYVFNDQIPMSWDELREIAELFTKSYNASSPTNYGFFNEWWFSFGWGVGGDCLEWDEDLGQYVMAPDEEFCYDRERADVVGGVLPPDGCEAAFMTRLRNLVLSNADDHAAADWGDIYLAGEESFFVTAAPLRGVRSALALKNF